MFDFTSLQRVDLYFLWKIVFILWGQEKVLHDEYERSVDILQQS